MRRLSITAGYPDCHFGAPPPANTSGDALLTRVLALETATNNRVSAVSTLVASVSSAAAANNASIMAAVSQAATVSTMTGSVSSMTASLSSGVSNAQSQVRVQSTLQVSSDGSRVSWVVKAGLWWRSWDVGAEGVFYFALCLRALIPPLSLPPLLPQLLHHCKGE